MMFVNTSSAPSRKEFRRPWGDVELTEMQGELLPMLVACQPAVAMIRFQAKPAEAEKLQNSLMAARMPKAITSIDTPMLDGGSLQSTCD